jgi:hypothetical protein
MKIIFSLFTVCLCLTCIVTSNAQKNKKEKEEPPISVWDIDTLKNPIPMNRAMFTDKISAQIKKADMRDGEQDHIIETEDTTASRIITQAMLVEAPRILIHIENLDIPHQQKIAYHRFFNNTLIHNNALALNYDNAIYTKRSIENFKNLLMAREAGQLEEFVKANDNIYTLDNSEILNDYPNLKAYVFESVGRAKPLMMIKRLPEFAGESYADPLIAAAAKIMPGTILTYAQSRSNLSTAVRRNKDPLVKTIVAIADQSKTPLKVLPFLEQINSGAKTIAQIDAITVDPKGYYKALVGLKLEGTSVADRAIDNEINFRGLQFVRVVNELHDSPAPIRFKSLQDFGAEDLYFMLIGSQDEIYTSSFIWMFNRMMEKMKPTTADAFLDKLHKSNFRTFLRMSAGYNKLSEFLTAMDESKKNDLMREFVSGLEQGPIDDLEDAVNVADAFGSITDPKLVDFLKNEIKANYEKKSNEKGIIVYALLSTIFNGADQAEALSASVSDLLPPITYVPISSLKDDKGVIVQQVFFYGDKDGNGAFNGYINQFRNPKWKIESSKYWTSIISTGKEAIQIYANKPLPEEAEENDVFAQNKLKEYLNDNQLHPSVVIHRGHSYYLPTTLENLTASAKIVVLGSCGGYHNLSKVLSSSPEAHIISSKQIGAYSVNTPIINAINDQMLAGKDIDWISMWQELSKYFASKGSSLNDLFSDYVPPNKNLGAIFIKAYKKQLQKLGME